MREEDLGREELTEARRREYEALKGQLEKEAKRAAKAENKAEVLTAGLRSRAKELQERAERAHSDRQEALTKHSSLEHLRARERAAAKEREEQLRKDLSRLEQREKELQREYDLLSS